MKKNFIDFHAAKELYNQLTGKGHEVYLIEDHENDVYCVIDEEPYTHLYFEFGLHLTLLHGSHW